MNISGNLSNTYMYQAEVFQSYRLQILQITDIHPGTSRNIARTYSDGRSGGVKCSGGRRTRRRGGRSVVHGFTLARLRRNLSSPVCRNCEIE